MSAWGAIAQAIAEATGRPFRPSGQEAAGGGCINDARVLRGEDGSRYFLKLNAAGQRAMFEAEAAGLAEILGTGTLRVPRPVCWGEADGQAWLVLEYLDLGGRGNAAALARGLAAMHRVTWARFGWRIDNTIGATPQPNAPDADWVAFWRARRLGHQLELARRRDAGRRLLERGERLLDALPAFFSDYRPQPSLLHGDLWGGNYGYAAGEPVVFDPAVYYGDREADLAMTELFGGFPAEFYAAYREAWPLDAGYGVRRELYNLYHVLNHYNLFGGGYAGQAEAMLGRLLAEAGVGAGLR